MGIETALAIGVVAVMAAAVVLAIVVGSKNPNNMSPLGLDKFQITQCNEGECIPLVWGKVKMTTNILWYGNLVSKAEKAAGGGKGMGGKMTTGYRYFLDIWLGICMGPNVVLESVYIQDKYQPLSVLGSYYLNDGSSSYYPTEPGVYANKLAGQAHLFLDRYDLGVGATFVPNLSFIVSRTTDCPLTYSNLSNGANPAAIIWDLLVENEVPTGLIDVVSFQEAATYWYQQGYGLNIIINAQASVDEQIGRLQTYVDFVLDQDYDGVWCLKVLKNTDVAVATLTADDVKDFQFIRKTWNDTANDFRATFIDKDQDFTQRVITIDNVASISLIGHRIQKSIDLTAFNSVDITSKRLSELMKFLSYPDAQVQCQVPYSFIALRIGDVVNITNDDYLLSNTAFRVLSLEETDDSNYVKLTLSEMKEHIFDPNYYDGGGSEWVAPDYTPDALAHEAMFELPYTETFGSTPTLLCLGQRQGVEDGFTIYSTSSLILPISYKLEKVITTFSTHALLIVNYNAMGYTIDDDVGIIITPHRFDPVWESTTRADLFSTRRVLICGNEMMTFQTITPLSIPVGAYQLTGVCRGVMGTPIEDHTTGDSVWITEIEDNIIQGAGASLTHYKFVPYFGSQVVDVADCSFINPTLTLKAITPLGLSRVVAERTSATDVDITLTPSVYNVGLTQNSAGAKDAYVQTDKSPPDVLGEVVEYKINIGGTWTAATLTTPTTFSYSQSGVHHLYIRYSWNGVKGPIDEYVDVGSTNGTYYGPQRDVELT